MISTIQTVAGDRLAFLGPRLFCLGLLVFSPLALAAKQKSTDLSTMSIEDLLNVQVVTASKKEQTLAHTAAAVYVITAEEIARSGFTSVPEALRLAPGVQVAQIDSSTWAIAIRGFNSQYSDKLLVLVDGRTVYFSTFSGVYWNVQDLMLEDVERIEVIRGPGAAVWGANAVDGVINVLTKDAKHTQGGLITVTGGTHDQASVGMRYGGKFGGVNFRVVSKLIERGPFDALGGGSNHDRWDLARLRFRSDWTASQRDAVMAEGELYQSSPAQTLALPALTPPFTTLVNNHFVYSGGSMLLRWKHTSTSGTETTGQAFYDRSHAGNPAFFGTTDQTFDADFQQQTRLGARNDLVWGMGFRYVDENTSPTFTLAFIPSAVNTRLFSGFAQDEIELRKNRLWLSLGSKLEHNDYTGAEIQPDVRLLWRVHPRHSVWAAISRAVRTPSSYEERVRFNLLAQPTPQGIPALVVAFGNPHFNSEKETAYEWGYRTQATHDLSFDLTSFYNSYGDISSSEPQQPFLTFDPLPPHIVVPLQLANDVHGHSYGVEASGVFTLARRWKFSASYSFLHLFLEPNAAHPAAQPSLSNGYPEHLVQAHCFLSLLRNLQFDTSVYHFSALPAQPVPAYTRLDVHLSWSPFEKLQLSSGFQNLLDARHLEFAEPGRPAVPGLVPRSAYGKVTWSF